MYSILIIPCSHLSIHSENVIMADFILVVAALVTGFIFGVLSMAADMISMEAFGFFLTIPTAMMLHGIGQAYSNGPRIRLYRYLIKWHVLVFYYMVRWSCWRVPQDMYWTSFKSGAP